MHALLPPAPAARGGRSAAAPRAAGSTCCSRWTGRRATRGAAPACRPRVRRAGLGGAGCGCASGVPAKVGPCHALTCSCQPCRVAHQSPSPWYLPDFWLHSVLTLLFLIAEEEPALELDFQLEDVALRLARKKRSAAGSLVFVWVSRAAAPVEFGPCCSPAPGAGFWGAQHRLCTLPSLAQSGGATRPAWAACMGVSVSLPRRAPVPVVPPAAGGGVILLRPPAVRGIPPPPKPRRCPGVAGGPGAAVLGPVRGPPLALPCNGPAEQTRLKTPSLAVTKPPALPRTAPFVPRSGRAGAAVVALCRKGGAAAAGGPQADVEPGDTGGPAGKGAVGWRGLEKGGCKPRLASQHCFLPTALVHLGSHSRFLLPCPHHCPQFARMRKEYVPAYAEHLRQLAAGQGPRRIERLPAPVVEMDRQLPEQTILMFRCAAAAGQGWLFRWQY